jgi:ABC-type uncharacterized transport system permease subunit
MQFDTNVPLSLVNVLEGLIIILMTATALQLTRRRRTPATGESLPDKVTAGAETAAAGGGA